MEYSFCNINKSKKIIADTANILFNTFQDINTNTWPTYKSALLEVKDCIKKPNICIGICMNDILLGWIGLRPMYEKTWELHPMVIGKEYQSKGLGKILINKLEEQAKKIGIIGIVLGTDDETNRTSISNHEVDEKNICSEIQNIKNIRRHPFEFYQKCGYIIIGIVPNANGLRKPDIWMWKNLL
jgi:aminoglycoside 6'-N-acetyltransferase I